MSLPAPALLIRSSGAWVQIPDDETDPVAWAARFVPAQVERRGLRESAAVLAFYEQTWVGLLQRARQRRAEFGDGPQTILGSYALLGEGDVLPVTTAEFVSSSTDGLSIDQLIDGMVMADGMGAPAVEELTDAPLSVFRVVQHVVREAPGGGQGLEATVQYVWAQPVEGVDVVLHSWFVNALDLEAAQPQLDALAIGVDVELSE